MQRKNKLNEYYFQGIRWIPSYGDFDQDDATITAKNRKEAWEELNKKYKNWKGVSLTHVNGRKIKQK